MNDCQLYLITPPAIELVSFLPALETALAVGGVACVQLRLKEADDAYITHAAKEIMPLCAAFHTAFILNDRPDLAAELQADGVHLGQDDAARWSVAKVRAMMGADAAIGVSCHNSSHLAMEAGEQGADYVAFGAFYPTKSKNPEYLARWGTPTLEMLAGWSQFSELPSVAIGGMTPGNCKPMIKAGANFIAAISYIWEHPDGAGAAVRKFNQAIREN